MHESLERKISLLSHADTPKSSRAVFSVVNRGKGAGNGSNAPRALRGGDELDLMFNPAV